VLRLPLAGEEHHGSLSAMSPVRLSESQWARCCCTARSWQTLLECLHSTRKYRPIKPEQPTLPSHSFKGWHTAVGQNIAVSGQPQSTQGRSRDVQSENHSINTLAQYVNFSLCCCYSLLHDMRPSPNACSGNEIRPHVRGMSVRTGIRSATPPPSIGRLDPLLSERYYRCCV
jgi:hypothetical protein